MIDETYIAQAVFVLLCLIAGWFLLRWAVRRAVLRSYTANLPGLDPSTVLFGDKWDIGLSRDRSFLHLMRRSGLRVIRMTSIRGYKRKDERQTIAGRPHRMRDIWISDVVLEFKGDQGLEEEPLSYGAPVEVARICRYLDGLGIRRLAVKTKTHY